MAEVYRLRRRTERARLAFGLETLVDLAERLVEPHDIAPRNLLVQDERWPSGREIGYAEALRRLPAPGRDGC